jgi:hypothetical protein
MVSIRRVRDEEQERSASFQKYYHERLLYTQLLKVEEEGRLKCGEEDRELKV